MDEFQSNWKIYAMISIVSAASFVIMFKLSEKL